MSAPNPSPQHHAADQEEQAHRLSTVAAARRVRVLRAQVAKHDANEFCKFVLKDERTGRPIVQAPMHASWHKLCDQHDRVLFWSHVEAGKTSQLAVGRVLWELGRDSRLRICVVSNTSDLAKKMTRQCGQYIEKSRELHEVFPHLVPTQDPSLPWKSQALTVQREGMGAKDPSIQAAGVHGNVMGSRIDLLVLDDVLDYENTHTPAPREDVWRWVKSTLFGRLTENARVIVVGNAWHPEDLMHRLEKEERFYAFRFPVVGKAGELTWPERWPKERIEKARLDLGPFEYARQLLCVARDDTSARFKREWVETCMKLGDGLSPVSRIEDLFDPVAYELPEGVTSWEELAAAQESIWRLTGKAAVVTGVDLAVQRGDANDLTALFTIYIDEEGTRRVLECQAGKWTGPEIIDRIEDVHARFGSIVVVENNAAQDYILQFARKRSAVPVVPFTTGRNKAHPEFGIEGLAVEMSNGKWKIPNHAEKMHAEVQEWVEELLYYDPREHTGDRLMASWFAREGARRYADGVWGGTGRVGVRTF